MQLMAKSNVLLLGVGGLGIEIGMLCHVFLTSSYTPYKDT